MMIHLSQKETIGGLLDWATDRFKEKRIEFADTEARYLLAGMLGGSTTDLVLNSEKVLTIIQREKFQAMVERRVKHEPAAYILGEKEFMGLQFQVDNRVLIPRPETELLVEEAVRMLKSMKVARPQILDVGTGSGAIAVALAQALPAASLLAVDISLGALKVAQVNARQNKVGGQVALLLSNTFDALPAEKTGSFDMIVSNPPYVASSEITRLEPELSFEPRQALDGGPEGLRVINRLIDQGRVFLKPGGVLLLEIGYDQGLKVQRNLESAGYRDVSILKDYGGQDRIAKGKFIGPV